MEDGVGGVGLLQSTDGLMGHIHSIIELKYSARVVGYKGFTSK